MKGLFQIARVIRPEGAFGMLMHRGLPFAVCLERTFDTANGGERVVVPDGLSMCSRDFYHKGGYETFEIQVPGHDRVLFHIGNREVDSKACVLVGESYANFAPAPGIQDPGIADSRAGFAEFMKLVAGVAEFDLYVVTVKEISA